MLGPFDRRTALGLLRLVRLVLLTGNLLVLPKIRARGLGILTAWCESILTIKISTLRQGREYQRDLTVVYTMQVVHEGKL